MADLTIVPDFPYTGTWYDLMDDTGAASINVTNTADPIAIPAGQFRIFGNQQSVLSTEEFQNTSNTLSLYPNPASDSFKLDKRVEEVHIYDVTGKQIKTFQGGFTAGHSFDVSELTRALYLVKVVSDKGTTTKRLLIE